MSFRITITYKLVFQSLKIDLVNYTYMYIIHIRDYMYYMHVLYMYTSLTVSL